MKNKYELTFPQKNIWLVDKVNQDTPINVIVGIINIKNGFNEKICDISINEFIKNNDGVRIKIDLENDKPMQYIEEYAYEKIEDIDLAKSTSKKIDDYICANALRPFLLIKSKLYDFKIIRTGKDQGIILIKLHHMICDAWSYSQVGKQIMGHYEKIITNAEPETLDIPSYVDFIETEKKYSNSDKEEKDQNFFKEYLSDLKDPISIKESTLFMKTEAKRYSVILSKEENEAISNYCSENKISPYVLFLSALSTYIYRIKDSSDFVIGTPVLNRSGFKEKQMIGMFVSTLPLRVKIQENEKFIDLAKNISRDTMSLFRHQRYPYSKTLEYVHKNSDVKSNLYNVVLSYQNARIDLPNEDRFYTEWIFNKNISDQLQIHIMDMDSTGKLNIHYDYLKDVFTKIEIEYLHTRLMSIIQDAMQNIDIDVENIRIMSKEEENKILYEFNNTSVDYPKDKTIIDLFEEQAEKNPDKVALVFEDKQMTYRELNEKANQLAWYLRDEKKINPGDKVALIIDKSLEMMVGIVAILKCGAIYVPIETDYPITRIEYILNDSNAKLILIAKEFKINKSNTLIVNFENIKIFNSNIGKLYNKFDVDSPVYIMYTSGTTGNPKGVIVNNRNVIRLIINTNYIKFYNNDRIIQTGSTAFDATTFEYFGALFNGLPLYLLKKQDLLDLYKFREFIKNNNITIIFMTTQLFNQIAEFDPYTFSNVRVLLIGGEALSIKHVNIVREKCPNLDFNNVYGPTENTTFSTFFPITHKFKGSIPIGKPISNTTAYVVDKKNRILPIFVTGELVLGGEGVTKGYLNKLDITLKSYVNVKQVLGRVYKTGDMSYFIDSGNISFVGRIDNQVKIRGFRIELDEINKVIEQYDQIDHSIVVAEKEMNSKVLVNYYVNKSDYVIDNKIKAFLRKKLPIYMIPKYYVKIPHMPLNSNGKIDKNKLIEYRKKTCNTLCETCNVYEGVYLKIYNIFKEILNVNEIYKEDNFFDIGGDSLKAVELVTKAMGQQIMITYADLYKYPTIKELGDMLIKKHEKESISYKIKYYNYNKVNLLLSENKAKNIKASECEKLGNILLTGVTGFLGAHILDSFLSNESGVAYCLIREKNGESIDKRIKERLRFFFGNKYDSEIGKRIILINGDLTNDKIFDDNYINKLNINTVINSAAYVKHFGDYQYFENINIHGVENLINYCLKYNKKLIHISTLSVSGNILETGQIQQEDIDSNTIYNEENFYIGQNLDNIYAYTKFMGEKVVLDAIVEKGLDARIMRMGNLTGRYNDGKFQPNVEENAFANRLKTIIELNVIPDNILSFYLEFTPIDYAAKAVILLSKTPKQYNVFHLFNHKHSQMEYVDNVFKKIGINLRHITKSDMTELIDMYSKENEGYKKIQGIILDINKNKELEYKPNTIVKSDFTIEILKELGFEWPEISDTYIIKYIEYLYEIGFFIKGE
ncbi:MAG: amino acid adenylation domain-containing protein [Clostridia bacterium]